MRVVWLVPYRKIKAQILTQIEPSTTTQTILSCIEQQSCADQVIGLLSMVL